MILDYIRQYDFATKTNIDHLVLDILPAVLDEKKKLIKLEILFMLYQKEINILKIKVLYDILNGL